MNGPGPSVAAIRASERSLAIRAELQDIQRNDPDRKIRVEAVHEWAVTHHNSAIHAELQWDDAKAGYQFRLQQIRGLIRLHIVSSEGKRETINLSIERRDSPGYRDTQVVMQTPVLRQAALRDTVMDLRSMRNRAEELFPELKKVWKAILKAEQDYL